MKRKLFIYVLNLIAIAGVLAVGSSTVQAALTLNVGNSGISGYTGPYATATINLINSTQATITFNSVVTANYVYLMAGQGAVGVNVNAGSWTISNITETNTYNGFSIPPGPGSDGGANNEDGFGKFNQTVDNFDGYQHSATQISFTLTNTDAGGSWANEGQVLTATANGYMAAAHIFVANNLGSNNLSNTGATGYAVDGGPHGDPLTVPEPMSLAIWSLGLGCACVVGARRRKA